MLRRSRRIAARRARPSTTQEASVNIDTIRAVLSELEGRLKDETHTQQAQTFTQLEQLGKRTNKQIVELRQEIEQVLGVSLTQHSAATATQSNCFERSRLITNPNHDYAQPRISLHPFIGSHSEVPARTWLNIFEYTTEGQSDRQRDLGLVSYLHGQALT